MLKTPAKLMTTAKTRVDNPKIAAKVATIDKRSFQRPTSVHSFSINKATYIPYAKNSQVFLGLHKPATQNSRPNNK
jgi:hypothetical protein